MPTGGPPRRRLAAVADGGQLLLTRPAAALVSDEVTLEPLGAHRLKDFPEPEQLFCAVVDGRGASAFAPPRTSAVRPTNLPPAPPALVGRDDDVQRVREALIGGERLVTITGRGGAGKTSVARVLAESLLDEHPGGVWWVSLASETSPDNVLPRVAAAIKAKDLAEHPTADVVTRHLRDQGPTLVVLDNFEHLLRAGEDVARG